MTAMYGPLLMDRRYGVCRFTTVKQITYLGRASASASASANAERSRSAQPQDAAPLRIEPLQHHAVEPAGERRGILRQFAVEDLRLLQQQERQILGCFAVAA